MADEVDHWYVLTYWVDERGVRDLQIPFASDKSFAETLRNCAALGLFPRHRPEPLDEPPLHSQDFSYVPAIGSHDVMGRLVRPNLPEYPGLSGDLGFRVEMSRDGKILEKELLFSTDDTLGQLVLQDLEQGLQVSNPGEGPGPFVDVLNMTFQNGALAVFGQSHYSNPSTK
jgi:hypothetical protein